VSWQTIHRIADESAVQVERDFVAAVTALQASIDIDQVVRAIRLGNAASVIAALDVHDTLNNTLAPAIGREIRRTYVRSGIASESDFPLRLDISFNLTNPEAIRYAEQEAGKLIEYVSDDVKLSVREVIGRGFREGNTAQTMAREIRAGIGLTPQYAAAVQRLRYALRQPLLARQMVARGASRLAIAQRFNLVGANGQYSERMADNLLAKPVTPLDEIERQGDAYAAKLLRYRAETISISETMRASGWGRHGLWMQAAEEGFIDIDRTRRHWITTPDDRLCRRPNGGCAAIPGMNPQGVRLDEPFKTPFGPVMVAGAEHVRGRCAEKIKIVSVALRMAA
jgi:hypothetical protein